VKITWYYQGLISTSIAVHPSRCWKVCLHQNRLHRTGLAIGQTVLGLYPCPDPIDRSRY